MKRYLVLILLFSPFLTSKAQNFKFGKVSKQELVETVHPKDSSAVAAVLFHKTKTTYRYDEVRGFVMETSVHSRIKIYSKEGYEWATHIVKLRDYDGKSENVTSLKANTFTLINGKVVVSKLAKSDVLEEEVNKYWDQTKFTMPNVQEGCVVEFKYKISSPFIWNVPVYDLQFTIPANNLEMHFETPDYYKYKMHITGMRSVKPVSGNKIESIYLSSSSREGFLRTDHTGTGTKTELQVIFNYTDIKLENVPALKNEKYVDNVNNYKSSIRFELKYIQFPEKVAVYENNGWEDVAKNIYKSPSFGGELTKSGYYKSDLQDLLIDLESPEEKISAIYYFVKRKVKWNGYLGKYVDQGVREAYRTDTGDVAEINLMLISMLKTAGLDANPVLLSTVSNGKPLYPTDDGFNYVIASVNLDGKFLLLDASGVYNGLNVLPFRTLNWNGRVINKDGNSTSVKLSPSKKSSKVSSLSFKLNENGLIKGEGRTQHNRYQALTFRQSFAGISKEDRVEYLENEIEDIVISEYDIKNETTLDQPVIESYRFEMEGQIENIGGKIYFKPLFSLSLDKNLFIADERTYPIYLVYPSKNKIMINLEIPSGYEVENLPKSVSFSLPDKIGSYKYVISSNAGIITIMITRSINQSVIIPQSYGALKEFYKQILLQESEMVVLRKK